MFVFVMIVLASVAVGLSFVFVMKKPSRGLWVLAAMFGSIMMVACLAVSVNVFRSDMSTQSLYSPPRNWDTRELPETSMMVGFTAAGEQIQLPAVASDFQVHVIGDLVDLEIVQTFENPTDEVLNLDYAFPLQHEAAVYGMEYEVGDEVVVAVIKRREQAQEIFDAAKEEGKSAALTVQHRPNVFTQSIANIGSKSTVQVRLKVVQFAEREQSYYTVNLPTKIGPRYVPGSMGNNSLGGTTFGAVTSDVESGTVRIHGMLSAGLPVHAFGSETHRVSQQNLGPAHIRFETAEIPAARDFKLRWKVAQDEATLASTHAYDAAQDVTYVSMLVEPKEAPATDEVFPREFVFLLDCSGSMFGPPMDASKAFMAKALDELRPTDTFRVIRFSDQATTFSEAPLVANAKNIEAARDYIDSLNSEGGTEMTAGIRQALGVPEEPGRLRYVVFLTDGFIGNDFEVIKLVSDLRGEARVYAIGVGNAVNHYVLGEVAAASRGHYANLLVGADLEEDSRALASRMGTPLLANIEVSFDGAKVLDVYPSAVPDVFEGQSVRVVARLQGKWDGGVQVEATSPLGQRTLSTRSVTSMNDAGLVGRTWARLRISSLTRELSVTQNEEIREEITQIGLGWSLMTQWTSFVAVSEKVVPQQSVPTNHGTPEPSTMLAALVASGGLWAARRKKKVST